MMLRMIMAGAVALWAAASAQAIPGLEPNREPFQAVRDGLAAEMALSAEKLQAGERHEATKALDRALHLAESPPARMPCRQVTSGRSTTRTRP